MKEKEKFWGISWCRCESGADQLSDQCYRSYRDRGGRLSGSERLSQGPGRGRVVSVADFGLLGGGGGGGGGVRLPAEEGGGDVDGDQGEEERGEQHGRVQVHGAE